MTGNRGRAERHGSGGSDVKPRQTWHLFGLRTVRTLPPQASGVERLELRCSATLDDDRGGA